MSLKTTTSLVVLGTLGFSGEAHNLDQIKPATPTSRSSALDMHVYDAVLAIKTDQAAPSSSGNIRWLVADETTTEDLFDRVWFDRKVASMNQMGADLERKRARLKIYSAIEDHSRRNKRAVLIPLASGPSWVVLRTKVVERRHLNPNRFPAVIGDIRFSRPGYDKHKTTAIVMVSDNRQGGGESYAWVLIYKSGRWKMVWQADVWHWAA